MVNVGSNLSCLLPGFVHNAVGLFLDLQNFCNKMVAHNCNSSAHRRDEKNALSHVPLQRGRKGEEREVETSLKPVSTSLTKSQSFSEISIMYFLNNDTFAVNYYS